MTIGAMKPDDGGCSPVAGETGAHQQAPVRSIVEGRSRRGQTLQPNVEVLPAPLDQPVGLTIVRCG
jgi:hypothetical protein